MKNQTIAVVYTSLGGLVNNMKGQLTQAFPGWNIVNIADDSLIREVMAHGGVTECVRSRLMHYFEAAAQMKPQLIISACSSVGEVAEEADGLFGAPVMRIDRAMIETALSVGNRIGVLASLETTLLPTVSYIERLAQAAGRNVTVTARVAKGAYEANSTGDAQTHDRLIMEEALKIAPMVDVILLAQGSMAKMEAPLREQTGLPVYSSPSLCVAAAEKMLKGEE